MERETKPVLFWWAKTGIDGGLYFHLIFEGDEDDVPACIAHDAMSNAQYMNYPVICLN